MKTKFFACARFCTMLLSVAFLMTACWDDPNEDITIDPPTLDYPGCYIINQGNAYDNIGGTLSYYDYQKFYPEFELLGDMALGDTPENAIVLGNVLCVLNNASSDIALISLSSKRVTQRLPLNSPQWMCTDGEYIYVTESDGHLARISLRNFLINRIELPGHPYACLYANNKIYINFGNSLDWSETGNKVGVVDPTSGVVSTIEVGSNPYDQMAVDAMGNVYTVCMGDYSAPKVWKITPHDKAEEYCDGSIIATHNNTLYVINSVADYSNYPEVSTVNEFKAYNTSDGKELDVNIYKDDQPSPARPICMQICHNGDIYVTSDGAEGYSSPGEVYIYKESGNYKEHFTTGVHPYYILFVKKW